MRFSLRWMLALTSYAALAAAALTQISWFLVNLLWLASVGALAFAFFIRREDKAASVGFVLAALLYFAGLLIAPDAMPSGRVGRQFMAGIELLSQSPTDPAYRGAAHAIGVMIAGMIGAALGALAARRCSVVGAAPREGGSTLDSPSR